MSLNKLISTLEADEKKKDLIEYLHYNYQDIDNIIYQKKKEIDELVEIREKLYKDMISFCNHKWEIDRTNIGEKTEWVCSICGIEK